MIETTKAQNLKSMNSTIIHDEISGRFLQLPPTGAKLTGIHQSIKMAKIVCQLCGLIGKGNRKTGICNDCKK